MTPERETVLHSWCVQADWDAPTVVGGEGAYLHLADGRQILDMSSLAECCNLGHQHPRLVKAIRENAERLCFVSSAWGAQSRAELAERLLERSGFAGGRVFFTLGGADANENAVKIARLAAARPKGKVITRDRSYHGATHLAEALSGDSRTQAFAQPELLGIVHVPPPYAYRCPFGSTNGDDCARRAADAVANALDAVGTDGAVAVLMEPNAGTNGIVAPETYWPALRQHCTQRGVWLIADEVMSAFGRCGEWFAWQRHGEAGRPDMMTLAKGLTGAALPLGAVVISAEIAARLKHQMLYAGLTYCGHPLSCAAGVAAMAAYEEDDLIARSKKMGARLLADLKQLQAKHPVIGDVRGGHGLFAVVELVIDRDSREPLAPWPQVAPALRALTEAALGEGVSFAVRGNLLLLAPPLVIKEDALDSALALLDRLLTRFFSEPPTESAP